VLLLVALASLAPWRAETRMLIIAFSPALLCSALNMSYILKSAEMLGSVALFRLVATAVPAVLSISLVTVTRDPVWVAVSQVVGLFLSGALIYLTLRRRVGLKLRAVPQAEIRSTARRGTPLLLTGVFLVVPTVVGPISVYLINGPHSAGVYYAAWQLSFAALTVAALVIDAIYPEMVRHAQRGREDFGQFAAAALRLAARATLPLAVGVTFAADEIIRLLFGSEFASSAGVMRIVVWIVPIGFCWVILGHALIAVDAEKSMTRRSFLVSLVTVVACPLGAYWNGPEGTAAAAVFGSALQLWLYAMDRQMRPLKTLRRLVHELPYALVPALFCLIAAQWSVGGFLATAVLTMGGVLAAELLLGMPTVRLAKRAGLALPDSRSSS
jgi:O-antigen/teichoic acid export membrane protein